MVTWDILVSFLVGMIAVDLGYAFGGQTNPLQAVELRCLCGVNTLDARPDCLFLFLSPGLRFSNPCSQRHVERGLAAMYAILGCPRGHAGCPIIFVPVFERDPLKHEGERRLWSSQGGRVPVL